MGTPMDTQDRQVDGKIWQRWIEIMSGIYAKYVSIRGDITADDPLPVEVKGMALNGDVNVDTDELEARIGAKTEAAVVTDADGSTHQYLRGVVKILADVWDATTHYLKTAVTPSALGTDALAADDSAALEASSVSKATPGRLYQISGVNMGPDQYIQIHNATALPAETAVPLVVFFVPTDSNFSLDFGVFGKYFSAGITWCNSTTAATKTIGAANCFVNVQYK